MIPSPKPPKNEFGSVLLEAMIAILIFSFGILGLIGLQATSAKNTTQAKERIDANLVANQWIGRMWADRTNLAAYNQSNCGQCTSGTSVGDLPNGYRCTEVSGNQVIVTIKWQLPGNSTCNSFVTIATITGN